MDYPISAYDSLGFNVVKGKMAWHDEPVYVMYTGLRSWLTVIEITKSDLEHNRTLATMCKAGNALEQETNSGIHYAFAYYPSLKSSDSAKHGLNICNDGAKIYCEPTRFIGGEGMYRWANLPENIMLIPKMPLAVVDFIRVLQRSNADYLSTPSSYAWNSLLYSVQFTQEELLQVRDWLTMPELIRYQKSVTRIFLETHFAQEIDDSLEVDWNEVERYVRT